jgi:hypothetical protein
MVQSTKMAFQEVLLELPDYLLNALNGAEKRGNQWFADQKKTVDTYFDGLKQMYQGRVSEISMASSLQRTGHAPSRSPGALRPPILPRTFITTG